MCGTDFIAKKFPTFGSGKILSPSVVRIITGGLSVSLIHRTYHKNSLLPITHTKPLNFPEKETLLQARDGPVRRNDCCQFTSHPSLIALLHFFACVKRPHSCRNLRFFLLLINTFPHSPPLLLKSDTATLVEIGKRN